MKSPPMSSKSGGKAHCSVCGDESSGFHYGVDSCEGCKGFFRRCITQGMNHKCANEEKCEITPFTRNSCQYCRLKKCFEVGMSREASRLGRRPKRLKEVGGEGSGGRSHTGNLPIAPYPAPQDMCRMRMEDLQKVLHTNGSLKEDLMQAFLQAAKASFQEHSKTGEGKAKSHTNHPEHKDPPRSATVSNPNPAFMSVASAMPTTSTKMETASMDNGAVGVDSPSSMHSPGALSVTDLNNLVSFDNFLFEQSLPGTPGGSQQMLMDNMTELQPLNSPFNLNNVGLEPLSATSPLSDLGMGSPLNMPSSSYTNGRSCEGNGSSLQELGSSKSSVMLNSGMKANSMDSSVPTTPQTPGQLQYQQYLPHPPPASHSFMSPGFNGAHVKMEVNAEPVKMEIKTEPEQALPEPCMVKMEPVSPAVVPPVVNPAVPPVVNPAVPPAVPPVVHQVPPVVPPAPKPVKVMPIKSKIFVDDNDPPAVDIEGLLEEVRQTPGETRRQLIRQVTTAIVDAHMQTTLNTLERVAQAWRNTALAETEEQENDDQAVPDVGRLRLNADNMWQRFVSSMVPEITKVVKFCKRLPGFVEITQEDQIRLIKQGAFEVMMTRFSLLVDTEAQTMLDPTLTMKCPREVIQEMPMGAFLDEFFCVAQKFDPLHLNDGEVGLFTAILIICPSRKGLRNKTAIEKIQSLFYQALYVYMSNHSPNPDERFCYLMSLITMLRRINEEHFKAISNIRMKSPTNTQFPDLHKEIFQNPF